MPHLELTLEESSGVAEARRQAVRTAELGGLDEQRRANVALVVTELATNVLKHAGHGSILVRPLLPSEGDGIEIIGVDRGPGMANIAQSLLDGTSTAGTRGAGLGAVVRQSNMFDVWSEPGRGTILVARIYAHRPCDSAVTVGGVSLVHPREIECGDAWALRHHDDQTTIAVVDGLGHGPLAASAAAEVMAAFAQTGPSLDGALRAAHARARSTRGAAASLVTLDPRARSLSFAGVGNVACRIVSHEHGKGCASQHGTLGHGTPRIRTERHPWPDGVVVAFTDGVSSRWDLASLPPWTRHHPTTVAASLWRDYGRNRDDATVVVCMARDG